MTQKYSKYIFTFQNEYMEELINDLCNILNISEQAKIGEHYSEEDKGCVIFIIYEAQKGALVFTAYPRVSYVYKVAIFVQFKQAEQVEQILYKFRDIIWREYGEDHRKEIIIRNNEDFEYLKEISKSTNFYRYLKEFIN